MDKKYKLPEYYVGIGASAGGLEAIEQFILNLPAPEYCRYAIVIIQHLSPNYKSMMTEILSKKTDYPVFKVEDGMVAEAGKIYLITPKKNLKIQDGKFVLEDTDYTMGINFPIDIFFRSLAEDQKEKAIGVILSGTGSDGTRGIRAIKQNGGIVFVQDPKTAKFDGMPNAAINTGIVDFVLHPSEMPSQIENIINHPSANKLIFETEVFSPNTLEKIFNLIKNKHGVDFQNYKPSTISRRIARRLAVTKCNDLGEYYKYILNNPNEIHVLFKEFLIGVTNFFRDEDAFEFLKDEVIPKLVSKFENDSEIRVWVPGCSTGEEAYSIGIILYDFLETQNISKNIKIFATDIDKSAIQTASKGYFAESVVSDIPNYFLNKYFIKHGNQYLISRKIRETIVFAEHNLLNDPPFTNLHLISCRNLLIYLKPEAQKKVFDIFHFALKDGGFLVLGTSESIGDDKRFKPVNLKYKIFESVGRTKILLTNNSKQKTISVDYKNVTDLNLYNNLEFKKDIKTILENTLKNIVNHYFKFFALVDEDFNLIYIEGDTAPYLKFPTGEPNLNLSNIITEQLSVHVVSAIRKVFKTKENFRYKTVFKHNSKKINLAIDFIYMETVKKIPFVIMIFTEESSKKIATVKEVNLSVEKENYYKELEYELQITKENLQATIEELETANEELQATNEELLASNEELQSTNEELQSTNEELYTVNTELQEKILEKAEIQSYLENLLNYSETGLLILDNSLKIKRFSPKIKEIFKIIDSDIGRSIEHINHNLEDVDIYNIFKDVVKNQENIELEVKSTTGKWYKMSTAIIELGISGINYGVIVKFEDITRIKEEQFFLKVKENIISEIFNKYGITGWYFDIINNNIYLSKETYNIFDLDAKNIRIDAKDYFNKIIKQIDNKDKFKKLLEEASKKGKPFDEEFTYKKDDKTTLKIKITGEPVEEKRKVIAIVGTIKII